MKRCICPLLLMSLCRATLRHPRKVPPPTHSATDSRSDGLTALGDSTQLQPKVASAQIRVLKRFGISAWRHVVSLFGVVCFPDTPFELGQEGMSAARECFPKLGALLR